MVNKTFGTNLKPEELLECAEDHFQNNEEYWKLREKEIFEEDTVCVVVSVHSFPFMYLVGDIDMIRRWSRLEEYKILALVMPGDPRTFLNDKDPSKLGITPGYWACECEKDFVRTSFSTFCEKCKTGISRPSLRCKTI